MKKILNHLTTDWYKYLLELIVITAGVLGAFALNSWNENVQNRKKEVLLLKEINGEFKANYEQFEEVTQAHQQALQATEYFLNNFFTNPNQDSIAEYLMTTGRHWTFNPSQSTITSLVSNSSIEIISNEVLRRELIQWSDRVLDYQEEEVKAKKYVHEILTPWIIDHSSILTREVLELSDREKIKFENILLMRARMLEEILGSDEKEGETLVESMKIIIDLTTTD